ncbi:hypothetical protein BJX70DRAFT_403211 [Aspergillus crustosus]
MSSNLANVDLTESICTPISKAWNQQLAGTCIDLKVALIANVVPNFITDILILALPGRSIWKLQATLRQRVSVIAVFLSGSLVVFAGIYRFSLIFIVDVNDVLCADPRRRPNLVRGRNSGVISACLPTLVPLIKLLARGIITITTSLSKSGTNNHMHSNELTIPV